MNIIRTFYFAFEYQNLNYDNYYSKKRVVATHKFVLEYHKARTAAGKATDYTVCVIRTQGNVASSMHVCVEISGLLCHTVPRTQRW